jgi:hypothetical protein
LGEASKFFTKCGSPNFTHYGVIHQFFIFVNRLASDRVDNRIGKMFEVWHWCELTPFREEIIIAGLGPGVENESLECILWDEVR